MGFFAGASDALHDAMVEQEHRQRQAMLDQITMQEHKSREEDRKSNREIQRVNAESLKAQREEAAAAVRQRTADSFENSTAVGTELDDPGAAILNAAGRGSHVTRTPASASARVVSGLSAPTADNPLGLDASKAPAVKVVEGSRRFAGTAKQQEDVRKQNTRAEYVKSLPVGPQRSFLEAQDATGDSSLPAAMFVPPKPVRPTLHNVPGVGLVSVGEDGHPKVLVASRDKPAKPGAPATYHDAEGHEHLIQVGADGTAVEIPLPAGITGKGPTPKHVDTPAEIEAKSKARAAGTVKGKQEAAGGEFSTMGMIANALGLGGGGSSPKPAANGAPEEWVRDASGKMVRKK